MKRHTEKCCVHIHVHQITKHPGPDRYKTKYNRLYIFSGPLSNIKLKGKADVALA